MWGGLWNSLVQVQRVARRTVLVIVDRLHVGAIGNVRARRQYDGLSDGQRSADRSVSPGLCYSGETVAIAAFKLNGANRSPEVLPQMHFVVEFDATGIQLLVP